MENLSDVSDSPVLGVGHGGTADIVESPPELSVVGRTQLVPNIILGVRLSQEELFLML